MNTIYNTKIQSVVATAKEIITENLKFDRRKYDDH